MHNNRKPKPSLLRAGRDRRFDRFFSAATVLSLSSIFPFPSLLALMAYSLVGLGGWAVYLLLASSGGVVQSCLSYVWEPCSPHT